MTGITSTLNIAKGAIIAQQYGLNVTGHNIANVNNPDYSRQNAAQISNTPARYGGHLFGTGVNVEQVQQTVDRLLENRLTDARSSKAAFEEADSYMNIIESFFDENSDTSINNAMTDFWNSWHDLSDNPLGSSERVAVYEKANLLAKRFNTADSDLSNVNSDINKEIDATITSVNSLTKQISDLNREIVSTESNKTTDNDQRDQRNGLVNKLGELIDVDTFEQSNGALIVNSANGKPLVNGVYSYNLSLKDKDVMWQGSYGSRINISDDITGGKLGGWLEIRDEVIPKYRSEINELSREMIWAMNYQHSQGAGLDYFSKPVTGNYSTDDSGLLSSYKFGDKIDYTKDFTMWTKDTTTSDAKYNKTSIDMGISNAKISDWSGTAPGGVQSRYKLTVMDGASIGNKEVAETDGDGLAKVSGSTTDVAAALDGAIKDQTLTVYDSPSGTAKIDIKDAGGDAKRSASSIAKALSGIDGVKAYASENSAIFDISNLQGGGSGVQEGDEVKFSLYVDGQIQKQSFVVDYSDKGSLTEDESLEAQFENALRAAAKSVNNINSDTDLSVSDLSSGKIKITSSSGKTLGVQDFEVQDNSGIKIDNFNNFNTGDTITFTVDSSGFGTSYPTSTSVSVDLTGVDTSKQEEVSQAFYDALSSALGDKPFTVTNDPSTNSVILRTTDGSDVTLKDADNDTGNDASFDMTALTGSASDPANIDNTLTFNGSDTATYNATTGSTDSILFSGDGTGVTINESSDTIPGDTKAGVITGTVTALMNSGMSIYSSVSGAGNGGLFTSSDHAVTGSSIMTLGGDGGFSGFSDQIEFDVDGHHVTYDVATGPPAPATTELGFAKGLEASLTAALVTPFSNPDYSVIRTGKSVSIIKNKDLDDPVEITNFVETTSAAAVAAGTSNPGNAALQVKTGTGSGTNEPENDLLESGSTYRDSSTSSLYSDQGIIKWEKLDKDGLLTGDSGLIDVEDKGKITIDESGVPSLSFNLSEGELVAGNTLTVNTDTNGQPDPLNFRITGQGNSKSDIYHFKVVSGGKVGHVPATGKDPLTIEWKNSTDSGTFEIKGNDPPYTPAAPVDVKVDGMTLKFYDGTLFKNDVFTITTDAAGAPVSKNNDGKPTGERLSDWHWTLDSFADQFNRDVSGMKASVNSDNQLKFESSDTYHSIENLSYSGTNGFSEVNASIDVKNWAGLDFNATDLKFIRSSSSSSGSGTWGIENDPTGGKAQLIPEGGDDDGFGVDFTGDGLADIEIKFKEKVSGNGYVKLDLVKHDANDMNFAFSDDASTPSGLVAAAGINTFFKGYGSMTMEMNENLSDTKYIAAAKINSETGEITQGDNSNALALADIQFTDFDMKQWSYVRGSDAKSSLTKANFDDYYRSMIGSMGIKSRSIKNSSAFADTMVQKMTEQRDSVSAVSLDEEMVNLMKYQHAFAAASKLIKVSDEMLNTLISVR